MSAIAPPSLPAFQGPGKRLALLLTLLVAFAINVVTLDRLGIAYDEAASALMARATAWEIVEFHWNAAFEHPPFWALLLRVWSQLAGQSEFALRLMPAFAATLLVVMTWRLVRSTWPHELVWQLLSAILVALAPVLIYYGQEARMYTIVVVLMLLSTYLVLRIRFQPAWLFVFLFWITCWGMLGLHYYAALALAIQAAVMATEGLLSGQLRVVPWGKLFIAYLGALIPVLLWMLFAPGFQTTLNVVLEKAGENPVTWQYFLSDLWRELTFGSIRWQPEYATVGYLFAPFVIVGTVLLIFRPNQTPLSRLGTWLFVTLVFLPVLIAVVALRTLVPRYILWIVPFFYILAAYPAALLWRRHWLAGMIVVLLLVGVDIVAVQYYFGPYRKSEYREMITYLNERGDPDTELLLLEAPRQHLLTKYYLPSSWQAHPIPTLPLPAFWPITAPLLVPEDEDDRIQGWLAEKEGLWVSYTSEAEVDRGEFLAKYLTAVAFREHCTQWLDVRLCHYVSPHHLEPTEITLESRLFGSELAMTGVRGSLYQSEQSPPTLLIELDWHAQQKPTIDYKVALRLIAPDGSTVVEANDYPIGALLPPTTWNADDRKPGYFALRLPADLSPGEYPLQLSIYDPNTLAEIPYSPADTTTPANQPSTESLTLAELHVGDTMGLESPIEQ